MYFVLEGIERKSGEYNGNKYDNYQLYLSETLDAENSTNGIGKRFFSPSKSKVKVAQAKNVFGVPVDESYLADFIGEPIEVNFNQYGNIDKVNFGISTD